MVRGLGSRNVMEELRVVNNKGEVKLKKERGEGGVLLLVVGARWRRRRFIFNLYNSYCCKFLP